MTFAIGIPRGMRKILEEQGINASSLRGQQMRQIWSQHDDFKNEKPEVIMYLKERGHTAFYLPKFHPELNPIERVWDLHQRALEREQRLVTSSPEKQSLQEVSRPRKYLRTCAVQGLRP